jgi:putative intracellular protease/amidase/membrane protease YdiL (CAAX protease family)
VVLVATPAVAYARLLGCNLAATFRLLKPSPMAVAAAALLATGAVAFVIDLSRLQERWLGPMSPEDVAKVQGIFEQLFADVGLGGVIVLLAVLPAICEEVMFRGFVLSGLRRGGGKAGPVLVTALMFAMFHLDPGRLVPTFLLGAVLGWLVVRSGSLFPAILMHFLYNAGAILLDRGQDHLLRAGLLGGEAGDLEPTWWLRGISLACLAAGVVLLTRARPAEDPVEPAAVPPIPVRGRVVIALPTRDFDTTEVVVPWNTFRHAGLEVVFASEDGQVATCDPKLLTGVLFGQLGALPHNVALYRELEETQAFQRPIRFDALDPAEFSALVLPGGHAKGMRPYLESKTLQEKARAFLAAGKPVGAICHGVLVLARADALVGRRVTSLTNLLEKLAYAVTAWRLGDYYRTYPTTTQDEVRASLGEGGRFETGPVFASYARPFVVEDGNLVTARWPGDAQGFADALLAQIRGRAGPGAIECPPTEEQV